MKMNKFKKAVSYFAVASVFTMASCQKEDMMQEQFASPAINADQASAATNTGKVIPEKYIVTLAQNANMRAGATTKAQVEGIAKAIIADYNLSEVAVEEVYENAITGFVLHVNEKQLKLIQNDSRIAAIEQDKVITLNGGGMKGGRVKASGGMKGGGKKGGTTTTTSPTTTTTTTTTTTGTTTSSSTSFAAITPLAGEQVSWGVARIGQGDGTGRTVWIVDSGVDTDHPDLNVDVSRSRSFTGVNSVEDGYGHGTSVAGVIAAKNNGKGVIGVAAGATVVALRVFDDRGAGSMSRAIAAVNHVISNAKAGDVVNLSIGGGMSSTLDNAVKTAAAKGILFAVAAGNSSVDCSYSSPARANATGIYTVSAMDTYGRLCSFSNYGAPVDFAAPGTGINTTAKNGGYANGVWGTSFAAPHVAGILLLKGNNIATKGYITADKDGKPDPIAAL